MTLQDFPPNSAPRQIVIGLAGHIDHGKSALVHSLTGAATDRRPEEQRRGMTVDLGFAHFDADKYRFALIDVPGHDRFVHNMIAGAAGVQLGLLVVAADDSVMPQTREHLQILDLLGVMGGAVAITKSDLVDGERPERVRGDIAELIADTTFADAPIVCVSSVVGRGIDQLRSALVARAGQVPPAPPEDGPFRLSIDRAFSLAGYGTIVTGTVRQGRVRTGESLLLLPQEQRVKVRHLERQGRDAEAICAGERAAINLAGIKAFEVDRGDELVTQDVWRPTQRLLIHLSILSGNERGLRDREQVRLYVGPREVTARVRLPRATIAAGERSPAVLDCQGPVVTQFGQPVVLRRLSPAETIGGGPVLVPWGADSRRLRNLWELVGRLSSADVDERLSALVDLHGPTRVESILGPLEIGAPTAEVRRRIVEMAHRRELIALTRDAGTVVGVPQWQSALEQVRRQCERQSQRLHPQRWFPRAAIVQRVEKLAPPLVAESAIDELVAQNWLCSREGQLALADRGRLSKRQQQLLERIAADISSGGAAPPLRKELVEHHCVSEKDLEPLLGRLEDDGRIVRISEELAIAPEVLERLLQSLRDLLAAQPAVSVAELRDRWQVTRKHALPYLQYFDEEGWTVRSDTVRVAGPRWKSPPSVDPAS